MLIPNYENVRIREVPLFLQGEIDREELEIVAVGEDFDAAQRTGWIQPLDEYVELPFMPYAEWISAKPLTLGRRQPDDVLQPESVLDDGDGRHSQDSRFPESCRKKDGSPSFLGMNGRNRPAAPE